MNWLPSLNATGNVATRKIRLIAIVSFRYFRQKRRIGRYMACVTREIGFALSGLSRPRIRITISTGTSVIARIEEEPTARVFVQARGRNIRSEEHTSEL